jgi:hypothetical protein
MTLAGLVLFLGGSLLATRLFLAADNDPALSAPPDPVMVAAVGSGRWAWVCSASAS